MPYYFAAAHLLPHTLPAQPRLLNAPRFTYALEARYLSMAQKTNAMRALDQRRIPYEVMTYSSDIHSADGVAEAVGVPPSKVFKTLGRVFKCYSQIMMEAMVTIAR